jgi:hypothetical protein
MARESKTIGVFRLLIDRYDARVHYDLEGSHKTSPNLSVTLITHGQKMTFTSPSDRFLQFCADLAREELGSVFARADMKALNLQLETVVTIEQRVKSSTSCCACSDSSFEMDDE